MKFYIPKIFKRKRGKEEGRGYTLTELLVAIMLFVIITFAVTGIFLQTLKNQRKYFVFQKVQENGRYMMESAIKEIRMSEIITGQGNHTQININHPVNGNIIHYKFQGDNFKREGESLNGSDIEVSGSFEIKKDASHWPRVTIVMKVKTTGARPEEQAEINLENTVSSRAYDK